MDPTHPAGSLQSMPLWQLKALLCLASLVVAALGVLMPKALFFREQHQGMTYGLGLSIGNMLSAGVMMSAALVHLLAEASEALEKAMGPDSGGKSYPWANVLCGIGFIFTLIAAQFLETETDERQCMDCSANCNFSRSLTINPGASILTKGLSANYERHQWHNMPLDHSSCSHSQGSSPRPPHDNGHLGHGHTHGSSSADPLPDREQQHYSSSPFAAMVGVDEGAPLLQPVRAIQERQGKVGSFVLATGLAIHAVIEGTAIGAQSDWKGSLSVSTAVLAHKGLTGYAIGSSLFVGTVTGWQYLGYLLVFSLSTPIGILIGVLIATTVENDIWAAGISAAASGTFLYSAVVEVLGNEMRQECFEADSVHRTNRAKALKLIAFIAGFSAMCLVAKYS